MIRGDKERLAPGERDYFSVTKISTFFNNVKPTKVTAGLHAIGCCEFIEKRQHITSKGQKYCRVYKRTFVDKSKGISESYDHVLWHAPSIILQLEALWGVTSTYTSVPGMPTEDVEDIIIDDPMRKDYDNILGY